MSTINISGFSATSGANFSEFTSERLQSILDFDREKFTTTSMKFWDVGEDTSMTFVGKGLTYAKNAAGEVIGVKTGTFTSFKAIAEGAKVLDITGLSLSGTALTNAIDSGSSTKFLNALLSGNDVIKATKYADVFWGGDGNDTLYGYDGHDKISGGNGNDKLYGGNGNDTLKGDAGNDRLEGGAGADKLYGGAGADTFVFRSKTDSTTGAPDTIYDFSRTQKDKIDLSAFDANTLKTGMQDFAFIGSQKFHSKAGELRYEKSGGDTFVYGDIDGNGKADFKIVLDTSINLIKGDFIL
nr:M10 family metallopeptidase C-terminal domain-containing protein [uncultured Shinella sp.]